MENNTVIGKYLLAYALYQCFSEPSYYKERPERILTKVNLSLLG